MNGFLKRTLIIICFFIAILICLLTGCAGRQNLIYTDRGELSEKEYKQLTEEFFGEASGEINMARQFLTCSYDNVRDIDFYQIFYIGTPTENKISDVELKLLNGTDTCPYTKITANEMNEVLEKYIGFSTEDTKKKNIESFEYLKDYDAYYNQHGDTNHPTPVFNGGYTVDDGSIVLNYNDNCSVTLRKSDSGEYLIVKNYIEP